MNVTVINTTDGKEYTTISKALDFGGYGMQLVDPL